MTPTTSQNTKPSRSTTSPNSTSIGGAEAGSVPDEGVELAALAARVDAVGKVREQVRVVAPAREPGRQHRRVDAGEHGADPGAEHVAGEPVGRPAPERKDRGDAGAGEIAFAVVAHVLEEQVAEDHLLDAVVTGGRDGAGHRSS